MQKKYVLLVGGQLYNKGAQSMVYTTVNEIKNRFPNFEVIMLSFFDHKRSQEEKDNYKFIIMQYPNIRAMLGVTNKGYKIFSNLTNYRKDERVEFEKILKDTAFIIDISGYALGSNWGMKKCFMYMHRIETAKKHEIPIYLFPQSFGPFNFKGILGRVLNKYIKKFLHYPKIIYAREQEGYNLLVNKYSLENVRKSHDLVLSSDVIDMDNIYHSIPDLKSEYISIKSNSVAIIPNTKNFQYGNKDEVIATYKMIIEILQNEKKNIYLIRHSHEDLEVCQLIKEEFKDNTNVTLIDDDLSCFEFNSVIIRFDFAIASRYHSIIHSYKNAIPCVAIGWATKYYELLEVFRQEEYIFDVRSNIKKNEVKKALDKMIENYSEESDTILGVLKEVQKENVFDVLGEE